MVTETHSDISQGRLSEAESPNCIYDSSKICGYPERLVTSPTPKVFVISSSQYENVISWFKEVFKRHIRTDKDSELDLVYFTDTVPRDFCKNVCIPIHESWFCIAIIKEELLPQYSERKNQKFITSFLSKLNPNAFFEIGLAMGLKKDVILYKGNNQKLPSDWANLFSLVIEEPSPFPYSKDIESIVEKLREIIKLNPFIGYPLKWIENENE